MLGAHEHHAIIRQQWKVALRGLPPAILGNAVCCILMGALLLSYGSGRETIIWMLMGVAMNALRYGVWRRYRRRAIASQSPERARLFFILSNLMAGIWWGLGLPFIIPANEPELVTLIGVFSTGLIAGAMASSAAVLPMFVAFSVGLAAPIALYFATDFHVTGLMMGGTIAACTAILIWIARHMARQTQEILNMRAAKSRLIRDLATARDKAEASDQAKSRFLATMSHELRTPLNIILGFAQTIEQRLLGPLGDDRYSEYAGTIRESGEHLLVLINNVLDLSRVGAGQYAIELDHVPVGEVVDSVRRSLTEEASSRGVTMFSTVEPDLPPAWADRRALRQILTNLMSNAIKFTDNGGNVQVSVTMDTRDHRLTIAVSDNGVGIPKNDQVRVLEPFVQADNDSRRRYGGSGLGLALSKSLAELQNGALTLDSEEEVGTTVSVQLPVAEDSNQEVLPDHRSSTAPHDKHSETPDIGHTSEPLQKRASG